MDAAVADSPIRDAPEVGIDAPTARCNPTADFGTSQPDDALNTTIYDGGAWLTPDELRVYFSSDRPGPDAVGSLDVDTATRASRNDAWARP